MQKHIRLGIYTLAVLLFSLCVSSVFAETFQRDLRIGDVGADVLELQTLLNADEATRIAEAGPGSPGNETTYFGARTAAAVARFQQMYAEKVLAPAGLYFGTGFFGPLTRVVANELTDEGPVKEVVQKTEDLSELQKNTVVKPKITSISPKNGGVGTKVTIYGEGFLPEGNTVATLLEFHKDVPSKDGKTLEITIKGPFPQEFLDANKEFYEKYKFQTEYQFVVRNASGISNFIQFFFNFY